MLLLHLQGKTWPQDALFEENKYTVLNLEKKKALLLFVLYNIISHCVTMCALLTAGRAKKEIPNRAKPADNKRPVHVCGVLSP